MSVHGAFPGEDQDEQYPVISYGHPKDRRVDLKQVQAGLAVTADGGIPVHARVFGGGAAEVSQVVGAMKDLQGMAGEQDFLMVADSKLVSYANVTALLAAGVDFIAPGPGRAGQGRGVCRFGPRPGAGGGLGARAGRRQGTGPAGGIPGAGGRPHPRRAPQARPGPDGAADPGPLHRQRGRSAGRPGQAPGPGRGGSGQTRPRGGRTALQDPREGRRPRRGDRREAPRRLLPALGHHRGRDRCPLAPLALRPGGPRRRGPGRRLVRADHTTDRRTGRPAGRPASSTRARVRSSAATTISRGPSRSPRSSCSTTTASPP